MLPWNQPVYLVHPLPNPDLLTIEEMAESYLPHILAAHPTGAFRLGGYCNGGLVAWEIARRLEQLGREIDFIVLIDVPSLNARPILRAISHLNSLLVAVAPKNISKKFASDAMRAVWARATGAYGYGQYSRVVSNYFPQKIAARVLCIIAEESRANLKFSCNAWNGLAGEVRCEYVPGTHHSCVSTEISGTVSLLDHLLSQPAKTGQPSGSKLI